MTSRGGSTSSRRSCGSGSRRFRSTLPARDAPSVSLTREQLLRRRSRTSWPGPATRRRIPGASSPAEEGRLALAEPSPSRWRRYARISAWACSSRPNGIGMPGSRASRCSRSPASTGRAARSCRRSTGTSQGSRRAASSRAKGAVEALHDTLAGADLSCSSAAEDARPARTTANWPSCPWVGLLRARPRRALRRRAARRCLRGRDHVSGREAGPRVCRRRIGRRRRSDCRCARGCGPELRELRVFDVYRGEQVGEGKKSIAFAAVFQSPERTLSDDDAAAMRERIVSALAERFGADLRA